MRVLVRVEVRGLEACRLQFFNLGSQFAFDLGSPETPCQPCEKLRQRTRQLIVRRCDCSSRNQHEMAADVEFPMLPGQANRMVESRAVGHQRSRLQDTLLVSLDNALVDPLGKAEVVGIHNQSPGHEIKQATTAAELLTGSRIVQARIVQTMDKTIPRIVCRRSLRRHRHTLQ